MKKKKRNGGYSLVELIIVIAIMATLLGILMPQYLKYLRKSKVSMDIDNAQNIASAVGAAVADNEIALTEPVAGTTRNVTEADLPNVSDFPISKVDSSYSWVVTLNPDSTIYITLGGKEIYPDPDSASGYRTCN